MKEKPILFTSLTLSWITLLFGRLSLRRWENYEKPIVIVCEVPGEEPRVVIKFDDYQEAVNHVAMLNQEANTKPYRIATTLGE